uniref:Uncharacterized protein n=1 Tax=Acrobeloides nanus TaxID=290746 RepID=A0A914CGY1_9BILA
MTNYNSWSSVVGPNFDVSFQAQYLFWVNWNGIQDLTTGFNPFGGWNQPYAHQYAGAITSNNCVPGINVSYDYLADTGFEAIKKNQTRRSAKNRTISKT